MLSLSQIHTLAARADDRGQPDHRRQPRQPQLHHDDLRVLDLEARTMTYARAGHTPLIHLPARGGAPAGAAAHTGRHGARPEARQRREVRRRCSRRCTLPLETGDLFVLFTDGISEAMNADEELFGEDRLGALVEEHADLPFDELRERILREVRAFAGEPGPHDDMTLILLKVDANRLCHCSDGGCRDRDRMTRARLLPPSASLSRSPVPSPGRTSRTDRTCAADRTRRTCRTAHRRTCRTVAPES